MNPYLLGASALGNIVGGVIGYKQEQKALDKQIERAGEARKAQEAAAAAARAGMPTYSLGRGAREAYMMSQQDRAGDLALQEVQRAGGDALRALEAGGARALIGGASGLARGSAMDAAQQLAAQQARRAAGQAAFAKAEQTVLDKNVADARDMGMYDYGRALGLRDKADFAEQQALGQKEAGKANLIQDITGSVTEIGMTAAGGFAEEGAKIKETPGEFSHKTNPIDLIRNGKKIGEATGGELIFNPEQSGKLEQLASDGDTDLHRYLRGLFKKFNTKK
tara:strand:+ start:643 stop:1479 length:837 start_codon:yes stop_codon:yes gene_type:complete